MPKITTPATPRPLTEKEKAFQNMLLAADADHDQKLSAREQVAAWNMVPEVDEYYTHLWMTTRMPQTVIGPDGQPFDVFVIPAHITQYNELMFNAESYEQYAFKRLGLSPQSAKTVLDATIKTVDDVRRSDVIDASKQYKETSPSRNVILVAPRDASDEVLPPPPPRQPDHSPRGRNAPSPNAT